MAIKLDKVSYQNKIKNISYEFQEEKITTVIGTSGSGKSLLSYLISGVEKKYSGKIVSPYLGREVGYIFQNPEESFIFSTVREEIAFGLKKYNYKIEEEDKRITDSLRMVGLSPNYLDKNPFNLSAGEKESLAFATVLALNPKILIIDEPIIYLDNKREENLIRLLKKMKDKYHKTIIIFTSDVEFALRVADNYLLLKKGHVVADGNIKNLLISSDKITSAGLDVPKIISFINTAKKRKNIDLDYTFDIKELMKDVYRHVK